MLDPDQSSTQVKIWIRIPIYMYNRYLQHTAYLLQRNYKSNKSIRTDKELSFLKKFGKLRIFSNIFADFLCASLFPVGAGEPGADQPQRDLQHAQDRTGVPGTISPKFMFL